MKVSIRLAKPEDARAMAEVMVDTWLASHRGQIPDGQWQLRKRNWTYEQSEQGWQELLSEIENGSNLDTCVYVAVNGQDEPIAIAVGNPSNHVANAGEVSVLYVAAAYQGQGLGRRLVRKVAEHQQRLGRQALTIRVLKTNTPACRFYESLGGELVGSLETEDYGFIEPQLIYGWQDIQMLANLQTDRE